MMAPMIGRQGAILSAMPFRLPVAAATRPTSERVARLMDGKGETRALQRHLETLCRVTGSASAARGEMEFLLDTAPDDPEAHSRYVELVEAGDGIELEAQRQAFALLERRNEPGLHKEYRKFIGACERPAQAFAELNWLAQNLPQGTTCAKGLERYRKLIERSDGVGWEQRRAAFKNGLLSAATATPTRAPALRWTQGQMERLIGDKASAEAELTVVVGALPPGDQNKQLERYVRLLELADGVELPSVREASVKLEKSGNPKLRESFVKLLAACGGNAARAMSEWQWLESQGGDMASYARLLAASKGSSPEQVRQAFTSQSSTGSTSRPPQLKAAHDTMTRLCGDSDSASRELDLLVASMPPSPEPDKQLKRYLSLLEKADGVEMPSVREAFVKLETANVPGQRAAFEALLKACDGNAAQALSEWKWLESQKSNDLARYASMLEQSGDASTDQVHQAYLNLAGHSIGKSEVADAFAGSAVLGLRAQGLNKKLSRLEELVGDRGSAANELQFALSQVKPGQDQNAVLNRYVDLVQKADGVGLASVREAFGLTEDPKVYQAFSNLLATGRQDVAAALGELKWLGPKPDDLERYRQALAVMGGERSNELTAAFPILQKLPPEAVGQLSPLVAQGVAVDQAARDLQSLYANLPPGDDPDRALKLLVRLRAEATGDSHDGVRAALTHLLKAPSDARGSQEKNYRHLLAIEGDPGLALQDLQWLVADKSTDLTARTNSYARLLAETDTGQREPIRKAMKELAASPGPPAPSGFWSHFRRSTSREEAFEKLYRWQGDATAAMKDLKSLEFHLDPGEDLGSALKEFVKLLEQTGETANTRLAFEAIRSQPQGERKDYKKDLFALADEMRDLELARRSLNVVRGVKRPEERQQRMDQLFAWTRARRQPGEAVDMLEAAANLMINGRSIAQVKERVEDMCQQLPPRQVQDATYAAARFSRMPNSPYKSADETLDQYVELFGRCSDKSELAAVSKILEAPGEGTVHDRSQVVGGIMRGLSSVAGCQDELTWLSQNLEPDEFLTVGKAYANLFSVISQVKGGGAQTVRDQLVWARDFKRTKNPRVEVEAVMTRLAAKLVIGASIEKARAQVEEELVGGQVIGEKDEWVIIGGTRVRKGRGEGASSAGQ